MIHLTPSPINTVPFSPKFKNQKKYRTVRLAKTVFPIIAANRSKQPPTARDFSLPRRQKSLAFFAWGPKKSQVLSVQPVPVGFGLLRYSLSCPEPCCTIPETIQQLRRTCHGNAPGLLGASFSCNAGAASRKRIIAAWGAPSYVFICGGLLRLDFGL